MNATDLSRMELAKRCEEALKVELHNDSRDPALYLTAYVLPLLRDQEAKIHGLEGLLEEVKRQSYHSYLRTVRFGGHM